jgi:hypothetical protein
MREKLSGESIARGKSSIIGGDAATQDSHSLAAERLIILTQYPFISSFQVLRLHRCSFPRSPHRAEKLKAKLLEVPSRTQRRSCQCDGPTILRRLGLEHPRPNHENHRNDKDRTGNQICFRAMVTKGEILGFVFYCFYIFPKTFVLFFMLFIRYSFLILPFLLLFISILVHIGKDFNKLTAKLA